MRTGYGQGKALKLKAHLGYFVRLALFLTAHTKLAGEQLQWCCSNPQQRAEGAEHAGSPCKEAQKEGKEESWEVQLHAMHRAT